MMVKSKNKRFLYLLIGALFLLLIPLIGMQLSSQVNWSLSDFLIMGFLLITVAAFVELVLRKVRTYKNRVALIGVIFLLFLLIWAELAVGVFGTPFAGS